MHILIIPSWYPSHPQDVSGVFFRDQAIALKQSGHTVGVLAPKLDRLKTVVSLWSTEQSARYEYDEGIPTYRNSTMSYLPRIPYGNSWFMLRLGRKMFETYLKQQGMPDVIHAHSAIYAGVIARDISLQHNIPYVVTEHSSHFGRHLYLPWQHQLAQSVFASAAKKIAVSRALKDNIVAIMPQLDSLWEYIPNVVSERFAIQKTPAASRLTFFNLAIMTPNKGQDVLLKAFSLVLSKGLDAQLVLGGDGPFAATLKALAKTLKITKNVTFLGNVTPSKVPELINQSDIMVVSSYQETFGVVVAEALMCGIPVVSTRCGGPESIIEAGDGILVQSKNVDALAEGMYKMSTKLENFDSNDIRARAEARFSAEAIAEKLTLMYQNL